MDIDPSKPTIVLVHGAFEDASIWNVVIQRLQRDGYPVTPSPIPYGAWPSTLPTSGACWTRSRAP